MASSTLHNVYKADLVPSKDDETFKMKNWHTNISTDCWSNHITWYYPISKRHTFAEAEPCWCCSWNIPVSTIAEGALALQGHQQQWHWLYRINGPLSFRRNDCNYLCCRIIDKWLKVPTYCWVSLTLRSNEMLTVRVIRCPWLCIFAGVSIYKSNRISWISNFALVRFRKSENVC